ncbi:MAG: DUF6580 family putative transport protein [Gemmataceae bacterium]
MIEQKQSEPIAPCWPLAIALAVLSGVLRVLPIGTLPANFAAMGALSLYAGARLPARVGWVLPLAVMVVSDAYLAQARSYAADPFVYGCFLVTVLMGLLLRRTNSPWKIGAGAIASDLLFFLVTNFAAWRQLIGDRYENSLTGLGESYLAALAFHRWTVLSSLIFVPLFFGAHALIVGRTARREATVSPDR